MYVQCKVTDWMPALHTAITCQAWPQSLSLFPLQVTIALNLWAIIDYWGNGSVTWQTGEQHRPEGSSFTALSQTEALGCKWLHCHCILTIHCLCVVCRCILITKQWNHWPLSSNLAKTVGLLLLLLVTHELRIRRWSARWPPLPNEQSAAVHQSVRSAANCFHNCSVSSGVATVSSGFKLLLETIDQKKVLHLVAIGCKLIIKLS